MTMFKCKINFKKIYDDMLNSGTTFGSITKDDLFSLKLVYPTKELLKKYDDIISKYNDRIFNNQKQNQKLEALRDWLLPMLMNGQVTVEKSATFAENTKKKVNQQPENDVQRSFEF